MLIIINQTKKHFNNNLFKNFLYPLITEKKLIFIDTPPDNINYDNINITIRNILYTNHITCFKLCILYDRTNFDDPIKGSIINNINQIKNTIINPISSYYKVDKLIFINIDNIDKLEDNTPIKEQLNISYQFDKIGYLNTSITNDILFTNNDFINIDNTSDLNKILNIIDTKINNINNNYQYLSWYKDKLVKIKDILKKEYNYSKVLSSNIIKNLLKLEISTYSETNTLILRINLNIKSIEYIYNKQLEIISYLILIATSNINLLFNDNKLLNKENHYEISTIINIKELSNILNNYKFNLEKEFKKINTLKTEKIEYMEFNLNELNFIEEIKNIPPPSIPKTSLFSNDKDNIIIDTITKKLYDRYLQEIELANKRIIELTTKLRVVKNYNYHTNINKVNPTILNNELANLNKEVKNLQQEIATYKQKNIFIPENYILEDLESRGNAIKKLNSDKINFNTFLSHISLIFITSICIYLFIQKEFQGIITKIFLFITLITPTIFYSIFQIKNLYTLKNKINTYLEDLIDNNNNLINNLLNDDKEKIIYIKNIYKLMMIKKYIKECNQIINNYNKKQDRINYHYNQLIEHIEINNKLMELLNLENNHELKNIDNIKLNIENNEEDNILYCPTSYLCDKETRIIINKEKKIVINNKLINFIDSFIIDYDKEYNND